jgi:Uma2 family endonuclease
MIQTLLPEPPARSPARTLADLWDCLGEIPLERILLSPPPGTATEQDLLSRIDCDDDDGNRRLCELVDGALVEKPMGFYESVVATWIVRLMAPYFEREDPGILSGADGPFRLAKGLVRLPDVCFVSWSRIPDRRAWMKSISDLAPDLAIEVLSPGNTRKEMARKLREYFAAGTTLVWYIDARRRTAVAYTSPTDFITHDESGSLDASPVLPGFSISLNELFDRAGAPPEE